MDSATAKPKIIIVCGPTGIGKTAVAIDLAQSFKGQIIGADSMQVYKHMDIGTAKPSAEEQARVVHHMVDILEPDEPFDAAQFSEKARAKIYKLSQQNIIPFVVGGTGLYIKALLYGLFDTDISDAQLRARLQAQAHRQGIAFLYERLSRLDPETAKRLHPNDAYRILRALEVFESTGQSILKHHQGHSFLEQPFKALKIGLRMDRAALYERINQRVDAMIASGFLNEVKALLKRGYSADLKSMQSIGYRHLAEYIQGRLNWEECVRTLKRDHRRYAKRQLTWFGADPQIIWKEPSELEELKRLVEEFMSDLKI